MQNEIGSTVGALQLFGDSTRLRLLALLAERELSVGELTSVTGLTQSRVSTHLARLKEGGVVRDRRDGASTRYALVEGAMPEVTGALWGVVSRGLSDPVVEADRERCDALLAARDAEAGWPDVVAGEMERHYSPGRTWDSLALALLGFVELGDVLDIGSGDGTVAQLLAPRARSILCLDRRVRVATAAQARVTRAENVRVAVGDGEAVPAADASFDAVLLFNVLTCCAHPAKVVAEAARVLRPGGRTVVVTLAPHEAAEQVRQYGHVHAGFAPARLRRWLGRAGLEVESCGVTSQEKRLPRHRVVCAFASKSQSPEKGRRR